MTAGGPRKRVDGESLVESAAEDDDVVMYLPFLYTDHSPDRDEGREHRRFHGRVMFKHGNVTSESLAALAQHLIDERYGPDAYRVKHVSPHGPAAVEGHITQVDVDTTVLTGLDLLTDAVTT